MHKKAGIKPHASTLPRSHTPAFLMCPPDFYGIEYEINPWMHVEEGADRTQAIRQWNHLFKTLTESLGARVERIQPVNHLPDMVFTANAGLVYGPKVILSNFRYPQRQGETPFYRAWFEQQGYEIITLPATHPFEGEGDALFLGDRLFAGYAFRTDSYADARVGEILGVPVTPLRLVHPRFYHLDTCFCPLGPDTAAYFPPAFDEASQKDLKSQIPHLIEITEPDAMRFAANAIVIGQDVIINSGCDSFRQNLQSKGFRVHEVILSQFLRAGGSAKCLVLRLN